MPSMSLSCSFAPLLKKGAASKEENQSTQKDCQSQKRCAFGTPDDIQNYPNESVFHYSFLLKFKPGLIFQPRLFSRVPARRESLKAPAEREPLNITQPTNAIASETKTIISVGRRAVNAKSRSAMAVLERAGEKVFLWLQNRFFSDTNLFYRREHRGRRGFLDGINRIF